MKAGRNAVMGMERMVTINDVLDADTAELIVIIILTVTGLTKPAGGHVSAQMPMAMLTQQQ